MSIRPRWQFGEVWYYWDSTHLTATKATARAKKIRSLGRKARVLEVKMKIARGMEKPKSVTKYIVYQRR